MENIFMKMEYFEHGHKKFRKMGYSKTLFTIMTMKRTISMIMINDS